MMRLRAWLLILAAAAAAIPARAASLSKDEIKKVLDKNPDLVLDVLRQNKKAFFEIVIQADQEERTRRQQEAEEAQRKELDERIKNPLVPAITEKTRVRGNRDAKYTLVEYSDFQCPYCSKGYKTVESLRQKYGKDLRVVFKNLPLPFHDQAMTAAQWFEAATLQSADKAWSFHDKLFENQDKLGVAFYKETAKSLGLDVAKLEKDAQSQAVKDAIDADMKEAKGFDFTGTPGFLFNGIPVRGAYPPEYFEEIIKKLEAAKAK